MPADVADQELRDLKRDYLKDVRDKLSLIRHHGQALGNRTRFKTSFPVLLYLAHQLKGSGGSLGFPGITETAKRMSLQLNEFLDDAGPRPNPQELSKGVLDLAGQLEQVIADCEQAL